MTRSPQAVAFKSPLRPILSLWKWAYTKILHVVNNFWVSRSLNKTCPKHLRLLKGHQLGNCVAARPLLSRNQEGVYYVRACSQFRKTFVTTESCTNKKPTWKRIKVILLPEEPEAMISFSLFLLRRTFFFKPQPAVHVLLAAILN